MNKYIPYEVNRTAKWYRQMYFDIEKELDRQKIPTGDASGIYTLAYRIEILGKLAKGYQDTARSLLNNGQKISTGT